MISPSSLYWEIGNAIPAMFKRKKIDLKKAKKAIEYYQMIPIRLVDVDLKKSVEISHQYNSSEGIRAGEPTVPFD